MNPQPSCVTAGGFSHAQTKRGPRATVIAGGLVIPREGNDMASLRQGRSLKAASVGVADLPSRAPYSDRPTAIAREMPEVVYAVTTPDGLIKIGFTTNLSSRVNSLKCRWADVLVVIQADIQYEKAMHRRFSAHVARGREYYHRVPEILEWINNERSLLGVSELAA